MSNGDSRLSPVVKALVVVMKILNSRNVVRKPNKMNMEYKAVSDCDLQIVVDFYASSGLRSR